MSKKAGKGRPVKVRDFKHMTRPSIKKNRAKITLKDKLDAIYNSSVSLNTTCQGRCECCKTAMPQMNFSEASQLIHEIWNASDRSEKLRLICVSIEYFFRNEFEKWGRESLTKPCMLLGEDGKCKYYDSRPLSCRMYGLWPESMYNARVDKFEKAYEGLLKREDLPLNKQCPYVKRVDETVPLTEGVINGLYKQLDDLDKSVGNYTDLRVEQRENYRTLHDWILLKIFGEQFLCDLTNFIMGASKEIMIDQINALKVAITARFSKDIPSLQ